MADTKSAPTPVKKKRRKKKKGISKQLRVLIGVGIGIAALLLVLFVLLPALQSCQPQQESESSSSSRVSTAKYLVQKTAADLEKVEVTNHADSEGSFAFVRVGPSTFTIPALKGYTVLQDNLNTAAGKLASVFAAERVEGAEENPADYGFDSLTLTVAYTFADDTAYTLEVGAEVPTGGLYYVREKGTEEIYITSGLAVCFTRPAAYVDLVVQTKPEGLFNSSGSWMTEELFSSLVLKGEAFGDTGLTMGQEDMSKYSQVIASAYRYYVTDGTRKSLLNPSRITELQTDAFFGLTAESVEAIAVDEAKIAEYGLDKPYKQLEMTIGGVTYMQKCSRMTEDGFYYVMNNTVKAIYKVSAEKILWAGYDYLAIASSIVFAPYINDTAKVALDFGDGESHIFETNCPEVADDLAVTYDGTQEIDPASYRTFFSLIIYCSNDQFLTGEEDLTVDPLLTITYTEKTGEESVIRFLPISARSVAIEYNGLAQFYMRAEFVDKIARELTHLLGGEEVSATW